MFSKMTLIATTAFLLAAAPLAAQADQGRRQAEMHGHGGMMMQGGMMGGTYQQMMSMMPGHMGMMMAMGPTPAMLLRMGEALDLTDDQVAQLEKLAEQDRPASMRQMASIRDAEKAAMEAVSGANPDFDALESHLSEASAHMVEAQVAMARAAAQARDVLTHEQRTQLHTFMSMWRGMMMGSGTMMGQLP